MLAKPIYSICVYILCSHLNLFSRFFILYRISLFLFKLRYSVTKSWKSSSIVTLGIECNSAITFKILHPFRSIYKDVESLLVDMLSTSWSHLDNSCKPILEVFFIPARISEWSFSFFLSLFLVLLLFNILTPLTIREMSFLKFGIISHLNHRFLLSNHPYQCWHC